MERIKLPLSPLFFEPVRQALCAVAPSTEKHEQNCRYRLDFNGQHGWVRVKQFTNGTLYIEATDPALYQTVLQTISRVTGQALTSAPAPAKAEQPTAPMAERGRIHLDVPYIGTDESGKGDYFGSLVIAGVYATPETSEKLRALGVRDSKLLKDAQIESIASGIQRLLGPEAWHIIELSPQRYNELYESFKKSGKNLNHLLAWGHAKVLETLLEKNPTCTHAIADQFGSEHYIRSQLQTRGQQITLHQTPKAEANVGVAAASILARARFVQKMHAMASRLGLVLPFGANALVQQRAQQILDRFGPDALRETAKLHFKTTETLTLPR